MSPNSFTLWIFDMKRNRCGSHKHTSQLPPEIVPSLVLFISAVKQTCQITYKEVFNNATTK